jgi:hypothetical protein
VAIVSDCTDAASNESPQEAVERCIIQLQAVHESKDSLRGVLKGGDPDNICTKAEVLRFDKGQRFFVWLTNLHSPT